MAAQPENVRNGVEPTLSNDSTTQQHGVIEQFPLFLPVILCAFLRSLATAQHQSTDVDHKIRAEQYIAMHEGDQTLFFDPENLQGACHACQGTSSLGYGTSEDGIHFVRRPEPVVVSETPYEKGGGVEDPRVVQIGDTYYLTLPDTTT